jgi:hypothetical protein
MWPFSRNCEVSEETIGWLHESFEWALAKGLLTQRTPLVTLSKTYFSAPSSKNPDFVPHLVRDIQRIMGISDAKIEVLPLDQIDARYRHDYQSLGTTGGTWQGDGESALIRYDPDQVHRPISLIATLAHEVMHHVLHGIVELPPGGLEAEELATDLHCIISGFGLFQLAGAEEVGWHGYMRQPTRAHALAMFLRMRGIPESDALPHLPPRSRGYLKASLAWIDRHDPALAGRVMSDT